MCPPGEALAWTKVSTSHSDVSPASINVSSCATHLDAQDELINKTHQLARPRLWLSMMGLMVEVVLLANRSKIWSKSCQKVEESSKSPKSLQRSEKFAKAISSEERLPKHRSSVNWVRRTRASIRALTVFQALFAGPRSSLNTTFGAITDKAKLVELLMLRRVCSPEKPGISSGQEHSSLSPDVTNSLSTPKFLSARILPPLLQLWDIPRAVWHQDDSRTCYARHAYTLRKKTSQPKISLMVRRTSREL